MLTFSLPRHILLNALAYSLFHSAGFVSHTVKYISHTVVFVSHSVKQRIFLCVGKNTDGETEVCEVASVTNNYCPAMR